MARAGPRGQNPGAATGTAQRPGVTTGSRDRWNSRRTESAKRQAARDLTAAAAVGMLTVAIGDVYPLEKIAQAQDRVDTGGRGRVLVTIPN